MNQFSTRRLTRLLISFNSLERSEFVWKNHLLHLHAHELTRSPAHSKRSASQHSAALVLNAPWLQRSGFAHCKADSTHSASVKVTLFQTCMLFVCNCVTLSCKHECTREKMTGRELKDVSSGEYTLQEVLQNDFLSSIMVQ